MWQWSTKCQRVTSNKEQRIRHIHKNTVILIIRVLSRKRTSKRWLCATSTKPPNSMQQQRKLETSRRWRARVSIIGLLQIQKVTDLQRKIKVKNTQQVSLTFPMIPKGLNQDKIKVSVITKIRVSRILLKWLESSNGNSISSREILRTLPSPQMILLRNYLSMDTTEQFPPQSETSLARLEDMKDSRLFFRQQTYTSDSLCLRNLRILKSKLFSKFANFSLSIKKAWLKHRGRNQNKRLV